MRTLLPVVILLTTIVFGCSTSKNPVTTETTRHAEDFLNAIQIFGADDPNNGDFTPLYHDVALAQICEAGQANPGREWGTDHGCIAVTLNREDNNPANPFKPVFRWLDSANYNTNSSPIFYVCQRDVDLATEPADYRAPACDAIYNPVGSGLLNIEPNSIEVAVAYMVRNRSEVFFHLNWDIEITVLQWTGDDMTNYWTKPPTHRIRTFMPGSTVDDNDQVNPDVAYFHRTGDIYVPYTNQEDETGNIERIRYNKYVRAGNAIVGPWLAQSVGHNGYDPSIDVGNITYIGSTIPWVALAYTAQFDAGQTGYHVNVTAWLPGIDGDHDTTFRVRNSAYWGPDAGLPCVDIAPNGNAEHVAALVYTQVTGSDGFGPTTDTFVVRFLGDIADLSTHIQVTSWPPNQPLFADSLYPSIAINRQVYTGDDIFASLAFMGQHTCFDDSNLWHPMVANMRIYNSVAPTEVGVTWSAWVETVGSDILGNYNISDIPFQNPGVASAIVTINDDQYWASWNDRIEMEPPPAEVWASWGFAGPQ